MPTPHLSRRQFLRLTGTGTLAAGLGIPALGRWQRAQAAEPEVKVPTLCEMCGSRCGIFAVKQGNRVVRIEGNPKHPINLGRPCARGNAGVAALYDPDRLRQPLKRGADGKLHPISWDEAFAEIGAKLVELRQTTGPQALYWGEYINMTTPLFKRFMEAYGSPNLTGHAATCFANRNIAYTVVYGGLPSVDYAHVRYLLSAGRNHLGGIKAGEVVKLAKARKAGAKIVYLDPRFAEMAGWADEWYPIRPGTDGAFLLALAHVLVTEELYDQDFVRDRTFGFEELAAALQDKTPEWAAAITDIPADAIRRIAREMAAARPAAVVDPGWHGGNGMYMSGFEAARAGAVVNALLGNFGAEGGLVMAPKVQLGTIDTPPEGVTLGDSGGG